MEDSRFSHIKTDPKFRRLFKKEAKVKIDNRFQSMFKDKKFKVKYTTDSRGRPVNHSSNRDLKQYYELSSSPESSDSEPENETHPDKSEEVKKPSKDGESDLTLTDNSDKALSEVVKKKLHDLTVDYARGESKLLSESSSDSEESEEFSEEEDTLDHKWGELDAEADKTEEVTSRLAACNMDWDRIRAVDLMVLFNSFLPAGGAIKSVAIYPSQFGKERMKQEEVNGPTELVETKLEDDRNDDENEEGSKYHMEKLRQYQLNRLKYYYAIISFDSPNSANKIYTECDGMEYESSAIKLDLRFVPDDMEFDDEPKEMCDKLPEINRYQPRFFANTALQQAKVELTWDETDQNRIEVTQKLSSGKIDDLTKEELQIYLASSSDEESNGPEDEIGKSDDDGGEDPLDKYKALLQDIKDKEKKKQDEDVQMEISWGTNVKEKNIKDKSIDKNPFEQYLEKRKEKKKDKKKKKKEQAEDEDSDMPSDIDLNDPFFAEELNNPEFRKPKKQKEKIETNSEEEKELELLLMKEEGKKDHVSLKKLINNENDSKKKKKRKKQAEEKANDNFEVNVNDERFSALYTSHHFNIDPTDSHFKRTKGMEILVNEKLKRRLQNEDTVVNKKGKLDKKMKSDEKNPELNLLIKSVKRKANEYMKK